MVESQPSKLLVASSILVSRSIPSWFITLFVGTHLGRVRRKALGEREVRFR